MEILLVDDDEIILDFLSSILKIRYPSIIIHIAHNGKEALALIRKNIIPAIIITDLDMPCMDGITLCNEIKNALPNTWIILNTGKYIDDHEIKQFDGFLPKPVIIDDLFKFIDMSSSTPASFEGTNWTNESG